MVLRALMAVMMVGVLAVGVYAAEPLELDKQKSKIEFVGSKPDGKHEGGFKEFTAKALADLENPSNGSLQIDIKTGSLWADNPKLTNHLKNPDFFDVRRYPSISFASKKIDYSEEDGQVTFEGVMKMLDKEVPVKIPAKVEMGEDTLTLTTEFKIDRTKWGMEYGQGRINNEVEIRATLVFLLP
jgi:polyisoprenoid-binding protein YceI